MRNFGNHKKFFRAHVRENASLADGGQRGVFGGQNPFGLGSDRVLERSKCPCPTLVARQIGNVLHMTKSTSLEKVMVGLPIMHKPLTKNENFSEPTVPLVSSRHQIPRKGIGLAV